MCAYHGTVLIACPASRMHAQSGARESKQNMQLRHPSNPHASKVSRRVELMTTALKTMRRVTTKIPRERLVVMTAGAQRKRSWGENERREEKQIPRVHTCVSIFMSSSSSLLRSEMRPSQRNMKRPTKRRTKRRTKRPLRAQKRSIALRCHPCGEAYANLLCINSGLPTLIEPKCCRNKRGGEG